MEKIKSCLLCLALFFVTIPAHAAMSPLAVAIVPPVQFPPHDFNVTGLRLSLLLGHHRSMYGIDLGVIGNTTDVEFVGLAVSGGYNLTYGETSIVGLQAAGVTNINVQKTRVTGLQLALVNSNVADTKIYGFAIGPIANLGDHTKVYGVEFGIYNKADEVYGFQIGVVNVVSSLHGLQIGLINFHHKGLFAICPIINVGW
jgi:hypothetical protein